MGGRHGVAGGAPGGVGEPFGGKAGGERRQPQPDVVAVIRFRRAVCIEPEPGRAEVEMVTAFRRLFIRVGDQECAGGQPDHLAEVTELLLERQRPAFREREVRRSENGRFGLRRVKLQPDRPPAGAAPVVVVNLPSR